MIHHSSKKEKKQDLDLENKLETRGDNKQPSRVFVPNYELGASSPIPIPKRRPETFDSHLLPSSPAENKIYIGSPPNKNGPSNRS